jgi:DNA processing protein
MPCGIEKIHPGYQKDLYEEIIKKDGLIISEMEGKKGPAKWTYPKRNRIVAGLSQATLVVQAAKKSGSLITANYAKDFNRQLFAVPGPLTSKVSIGTANLIKEGAKIVTNPEDIINFYRPKQSKVNFEEKGGKLKKRKDLTKKEKQILKKLEVEPLEIDDLAQKMDLSADKMGVILSKMQLKGLINKEGTKYHNNL